MLESFISILMILSVTSPHLTSSSATEADNGKDGFNFYKDYLRGRSGEGIVLAPVAEDRMLYFYRTPMQLHPDPLPVILEEEYPKRTGNTFKNHMLSKDTWVKDDEKPNKRTSKTALSVIMAGRDDPYQMDDNSEAVLELPMM